MGRTAPLMVLPITEYQSGRIRGSITVYGLPDGRARVIEFLGEAKIFDKTMPVHRAFARALSLAGWQMHQLQPEMVYHSNQED